MSKVWLPGRRPPPAYSFKHSNCKGMASSSSDIVAAMKAIAHSYSLPLTEQILSSIAVEIEPSDGVMYDDVVAYDYIHGELIKFGPLPPTWY